MFRAVRMSRVSPRADYPRKVIAQAGLCGGIDAGIEFREGNAYAYAVTCGGAARPENVGRHRPLFFRNVIVWQKALSRG